VAPAGGVLGGRKKLVLLASFLVPGSGHVLLGRPNRGLVMLFWMVIFGFVTFRLAPPQTGFIGRIGGGIAVWALSVVDVARILKAKPRPRI
jgi:hypothetical protein